jgi:lactoylglutathione lyase
MTDQELPSLRWQVNRVAHVVVNVRDLERSVAFWEEATPLRVHERMQAGRQPMAALGIEHGELVGVVLSDATSIEPGVCVHLVEWRSPRPVGTAYETFFHAGYQRICFEVADPVAEHARLVAAGIEPFASPRNRGVIIPGDPEVVSFTFPDPDGIAIHVTRRPPATRADVPPQLYHVSPVVRDVDAAIDFFDRILGLDVRMRLALPEPTAAGYGRGSEVGQFDAAILGHRGDHRFHLDLVNWMVPGVVGEPNGEANHVGIQRLAFEVDDIESARAALLDALPPALRTTVRGPDEWDLGEIGSRRVLTFRSGDGLPLELVETAR